ncbi:MAG: putative transposase, partial [Saprospiraceae bacterium]
MDRTLSSLNKAGNAQMIHEAHNGLHYGGVLLLIPALLSQGLLKSKDIYEYAEKYYYSIESIILTLAIMALCRIENIEQIKNVRSGELGRLIGMDRIPESKCLRGKVQYLATQNKAIQWNEELMELWKDGITDHTDGELILYVDGHVSIYNGYKATLPVKYISRQKLCLSATSEYWVNDGDSLPYMVVTGELNEKLQEIIIDQIIPQLIKVAYIKTIEEPLTYPQTPQCTLVFDREAYDFDFFEKLWDQYRIAIITYRKFVKDKWAHSDFTPYEISDNGNKSTMDICEKALTQNTKTYREIRKLGSSGHQTSIITTHPSMKIQHIALNMFNRWTQENFFKYMMANYNFDQIIEYGTETLDPELKIVNPTYKKYNNQL